MELKKKTWFSILTLSVFILVPCLGRAQQPTGALHGNTATINTQGKPVVITGVALKLTGNAPGLPSFTAYSNDDGQYQFVNLPAGSYTLEATSPGFNAVTLKVTISPGEVVSQNIQLQLQQVRQQLEVRESAPLVSPESTTPPAQKLTPQQLLTIPVAQQKFREELPITPGVVQIRSGKIYIKGAPEGQSMLLLDSARSVDPVTGSFSIDVPIDAIQTLDVYKAPFDTQYGGFVGGMTSIELKPSPPDWRLTMHDLNPSLRGEQGHIVGFSQAEPRLRFGGPIWKNKINFSESFLYEMRKQPIRGLAWPNNNNKTQGFNSITNFQFLLSQRHIFSLTVDAFPRRIEWANLNALIPRPATSDWGQRGYSVNGSDAYQFGSGGILNTFFKFSQIDTNAHGHGPLAMLLTPNGLGGNYFNSWNRSARQEEGESIFSFPTKDWMGKHAFKVGTDVVHRSFDGLSESHPVLLTQNDGTPVERIDFNGIGNLIASDTEIIGFTQDHWTMNDHLAVTLGLQYLAQTNGERADLAPRLGFVYALDKDARTVVRGGIGMFYDRTPLLAGDFSNDPTRMVTPLDASGNPLSPAISYRNVCGQITPTEPQVIPSCSSLGSTPYNTTWRLEISRKISKRFSADISTLYSNTFNVFVIDPIVQAATPLMLLSNHGASRYYEYQITADYRPSEQTSLSLSYVHSRSRGDLNTIDDIFVPLEQPVIRPNLFANLPSDVPDRLTGYGLFKLPWAITLSPSVDLHSGFPFSDVDLFQNYVGTPNSERYPIYFSLNWRVYKDFPIPFHIHRGHKFRLGIYSINTTGRQNPNAVYNNIASPLFGQFTGLDKRINGIVIEFTQ